MNPQGQFNYPLVRPIASYLPGGITPQAQMPAPPQAPGGMSQHQIDSYHTVLNLSTPQQRQQMLGQLQQAAQSDPRAQQLLQSVQGYNVKQPQQGVYHNSLMTNVQNGVLNAAGMIDGLLPNQTAGSMENQLQHDAQGRVINPQAIQGGQAASQKDVALTGLADRLMFARGLPGLAKVGAPVEGNIAQKAVQRGLQLAPQMGAAGLAGSFTTPQPGDNQSQFERSVMGTAQGLGMGLGFGAGGQLGSDAVKGIASGIEHVGPKLNQAVSDYHNLVSGVVTNESGHTVPLDPLGKGEPVPVNQPRHPAGVTEGGQFKAGQEDEYITKPNPNRNDLLHNIGKASDTLSEVNKTHEDILTKIQDNRGITEGTRNQLIQHHNDLYAANRRAIEDHLANFVDQFERKYPNSKLPKSLHQAMITELERVPFAQGRIPDVKTLHEMDASMNDGRPAVIEGQLPTQEQPTRAGLYDKLHNNFKTTLDKFKSTLGNDGGALNLGAEFGGGKDAKANEIAKGLGMSKEEVKAAKAKQADNSLEAVTERKATANNLIQKGTEGKTKEQLASEQARMDALNSPTKNSVDLSVEKGNVKGAIANSQMVEYNLTRRAEKAFNIGKKLSAKDKRLAYQYEAGQPIEHLSKQADDPARFKAAMTALEDYYDYRLAAERSAGAQVPRVANYLRHYWDLSDPAKAEEFANLVKQSGLTQFKGVSSQPRVFRNYAEGKALGFKPKHADVFQDLAADVKQSRFAVSRAALKQGVIDAGGDKVSTKGSGVDAEGRPLVNSNIDGLNGLSYSKDIADQLKGYNALDRNVFGKAYDKLNSFQKNIVLSLSFFHSLNISFNFAGATGFRHPFVTMQGLGKSALSFVSPKYYEHLMTGYEKRGVTDWALKNGIALGSNADINATGLTHGIKTSRANLITQGHKAIFEREIPIMTLHLAELAKDRGIKVGTEEGIKYGQEVNNVMGLLNQKILSRDPNHQKMLNRLMLAPAFTETKFRTLFDSMTKWRGTNQAAGNLARNAVLGKTALAGLTGILGGIIATGQFPTIQAMLGQATDPYIPTKLKNKAGGTKGAFLPHTFISELTDPVGRLMKGDTSGVIHYANARLSPNLATGSKLLTNQDYFGNPIFNPDKPIGGQIVSQAAKQVAPIGVQNIVNGTGKNGKSVAETTLDELGLRVKNDPNNAVNQQTNAYFEARSKALAGMNKNQQADFNSINPQSKNPDGSYTPESAFDPAKAPQKVLTLLKDQKVLDATISINQAQKNHDPMWDLPQDQLKTFLTYQAIQGTDYESSTSKEIKAQNPWIADLNDARSKWFDTLPPSQNPASQNPLQYPTASPELQSLLDAYSGISDSTQKSQFLQANPQVSDYFNKTSQYTNDRRAQEGVPTFAQAPIASPYVQSQMNAKNWNDPQVQQYLNATTAFKASGPFGDGISGAGGNRNTSQLALANLAQGLTANGKPSSYAYSSASSTRNKIKNSIKSQNRETKYAIKQSQKKTPKRVAFNQHHVGTSAKSSLSYLEQALAKASKARKA